MNTSSSYANNISKDNRGKAQNSTNAVEYSPDSDKFKNYCSKLFEFQNTKKDQKETNRDKDLKESNKDKELIQYLRYIKLATKKTKYQLKILDIHLIQEVIIPIMQTKSKSNLEIPKECSKIFLNLAKNKNNHYKITPEDIIFKELFNLISLYLNSELVSYILRILLFLTDNKEFLSKLNLNLTFTRKPNDELQKNNQNIGLIVEVNIGTITRILIDKYLDNLSSSNKIYLLKIIYNLFNFNELLIYKESIEPIIRCLGDKEEECIIEALKIIYIFSQKNENNYEIIKSNFMFRIFRIYKYGNLEINKILVKIILNLFSKEDYIDLFFKNNIILILENLFSAFESDQNEEIVTTVFEIFKISIDKLDKDLLHKLFTKALNFAQNSKNEVFVQSCLSTVDSVLKKNSNFILNKNNNKVNIFETMHSFFKYKNYMIVQYSLSIFEIVLRKKFKEFKQIYIATNDRSLSIKTLIHHVINIINEFFQQEIVVKACKILKMLSKISLLQTYFLSEPQITILRVFNDDIITKKIKAMKDINIVRAILNQHLPITHKNTEKENKIYDMYSEFPRDEEEGEYKKNNSFYRKNNRNTKIYKINNYKNNILEKKIEEENYSSINIDNNANLTKNLNDNHKNSINFQNKSPESRRHFKNTVIKSNEFIYEKTNSKSSPHIQDGADEILQVRNLDKKLERENSTIEKFENKTDKYIKQNFTNFNTKNISNLANNNLNNLNKESSHSPGNIISNYKKKKIGMENLINISNVNNTNINHNNSNDIFFNEKFNNMTNKNSNLDSSDVLFMDKYTETRLMKLRLSRRKLSKEDLDKNTLAIKKFMELEQINEKLKLSIEILANLTKYSENLDTLTNKGFLELINKLLIEENKDALATIVKCIRGFCKSGKAIEVILSCSMIEKILNILKICSRESKIEIFNHFRIILESDIKLQKQFIMDQGISTIMSEVSENDDELNHIILRALYIISSNVNKLFIVYYNSFKEWEQLDNNISDLNSDNSSFAKGISDEDIKNFDNDKKNNLLPYKLQIQYVIDQDANENLKNSKNNNSSLVSKSTPNGIKHKKSISVNEIVFNNNFNFNLKNLKENCYDTDDKNTKNQEEINFKNYNRKNSNDKFRNSNSKENNNLLETNEKNELPLSNKNNNLNSKIRNLNIINPNNLIINNIEKFKFESNSLSNNKSIINPINVNNNHSNIVPIEPQVYLKKQSIRTLRTITGSSSKDFNFQGKSFVFQNEDNNNNQNGHNFQNPNNTNSIINNNINIRMHIFRNQLSKKVMMNKLLSIGKYSGTSLLTHKELIKILINLYLNRYYLKYFTRDSVFSYVMKIIEIIMKKSRNKPEESEMIKLILIFLKFICEEENLIRKFLDTTVISDIVMIINKKEYVSTIQNNHELEEFHYNTSLVLLRLSEFKNHSSKLVFLTETFSVLERLFEFNLFNGKIYIVNVIKNIVSENRDFFLEDDILRFIKKLITCQNNLLIYDFIDLLGILIFNRNLCKKLKNVFNFLINEIKNTGYSNKFKNKILELILCLSYEKENINGFLLQDFLHLFKNLEIPLNKKITLLILMNFSSIPSNFNFLSIFAEKFNNDSSQILKNEDDNFSSDRFFNKMSGEIINKNEVFNIINDLLDSDKFSQILIQRFLINITSIENIDLSIISQKVIDVLIEIVISNNIMQDGIIIFALAILVNLSNRNVIKIKNTFLSDNFLQQSMIIDTNLKKKDSNTKKITNLMRKKSSSRFNNNFKGIFKEDSLEGKSKDKKKSFKRLTSFKALRGTNEKYKIQEIKENENEINESKVNSIGNNQKDISKNNTLEDISTPKKIVNNDTFMSKNSNFQNDEKNTKNKENQVEYFDLHIIDFILLRIPNFIDTMNNLFQRKNMDIVSLAIMLACNLSRKLMTSSNDLDDKISLCIREFVLRDENSNINILEFDSGKFFLIAIIKYCVCLSCDDKKVLNSIKLFEYIMNKFVIIDRVKTIKLEKEDFLNNSINFNLMESYLKFLNIIINSEDLYDIFKDYFKSNITIFYNEFLKGFSEILYDPIMEQQFHPDSNLQELTISVLHILSTFIKIKILDFQKINLYIKKIINKLIQYDPVKFNEELKSLFIYVLGIFMHDNQKQNNNPNSSPEILEVDSEASFSKNENHNTIEKNDLETDKILKKWILDLFKIENSAYVDYYCLKVILKNLKEDNFPQNIWKCKKTLKKLSFYLKEDKFIENNNNLETESFEGTNQNFIKIIIKKIVNFISFDNNSHIDLIDNGVYNVFKEDIYKRFDPFNYDKVSKDDVIFLVNILLNRENINYLGEDMINILKIIFVCKDIIISIKIKLFDIFIYWNLQNSENKSFSEDYLIILELIYFNLKDNFSDMIFLVEYFVTKHEEFSLMIVQNSKIIEKIYLDFKIFDENFPSKLEEFYSFLRILEIIINKFDLNSSELNINNMININDKNLRKENLGISQLISEKLISDMVDKINKNLNCECIKDLTFLNLLLNILFSYLNKLKSFQLSNEIKFNMNENEKMTIFLDKIDLNTLISLAINFSTDLVQKRKIKYLEDIENHKQFELQLKHEENTINIDQLNKSFKKDINSFLINQEKNQNILNKKNNQFGENQEATSTIKTDNLNNESNSKYHKNSYNGKDLNIKKNILSLKDIKNNFLTLESMDDTSHKLPFKKINLSKIGDLIETKSLIEKENLKKLIYNPTNKKEYLLNHDKKQNNLSSNIKIDKLNINDYTQNNSEMNNVNNFFNNQEVNFDKNFIQNQISNYNLNNISRKLIEDLNPENYIKSKSFLYLIMRFFINEDNKFISKALIEKKNILFSKNFFEKITNILVDLSEYKKSFTELKNKISAKNIVSLNSSNPEEIDEKEIISQEEEILEFFNNFNLNDIMFILIFYVNINTIKKLDFSEFITDYFIKLFNLIFHKLILGFNLHNKNLKILSNFKKRNDNSHIKNKNENVKSEFSIKTGENDESLILSNEIKEKQQNIENNNENLENYVNEDSYSKKDKQIQNVDKLPDDRIEKKKSKTLKFKTNLNKSNYPINSPIFVTPDQKQEISIIDNNGKMKNSNIENTENSQSKIEINKTNNIICGQIENNNDSINLITNDNKNTIKSNPQKINSLKNKNLSIQSNRDLIRKSLNVEDIPFKKPSNIKFIEEKDIKIISNEKKYNLINEYKKHKTMNSSNNFIKIDKTNKINSSMKNISTNLKNSNKNLVGRQDDYKQNMKNFNLDNTHLINSNSKKNVSDFKKNINSKDKIDSINITNINQKSKQFFNEVNNSSSNLTKNYNFNENLTNKIFNKDEENSLKTKTSAKNSIVNFNSNWNIKKDFKKIITNSSIPDDINLCKKFINLKRKNTGNETNFASDELNLLYNSILKSLLSSYFYFCDYIFEFEENQNLIFEMIKTLINIISNFKINNEIKEILIRFYQEFLSKFQIKKSQELSIISTFYIKIHFDPVICFIKKIVLECILINIDTKLFLDNIDGILEITEMILPVEYEKKKILEFIGFCKQIYLNICSHKLNMLKNIHYLEKLKKFIFNSLQFHFSKMEEEVDKKCKSLLNKIELMQENLRKMI